MDPTQPPLMYYAAGEEQVVPDKDLHAIEFPGVVKNYKKALGMLGGQGWVAKAIRGDTVMAKMSFRPTAAKSHHVVGDMHKVTRLLVKVRYNKKTKEVGTAVRGVIKRAMKFNGMCDFQLLPPQGLATQSVKDFPTLMNFVQKATDGGETTQPLCITPLIISRSDSSFDYSFRSNPYSRLGIITEPDGTTRHERVLTRGTSTTVLQHRSWHDVTVPTGPPPKAIEMLRRNPAAGEVMPKIRELFAKRPVWSKTALSLVLSPSGKDLSHLLRVALPPVAFTYSSGPYRNLYVRYGYNVRDVPKEGETHPVCYELVDLRLGRIATKNAVERSTTTLSTLDVAGPIRGVQTSSASRPAWPTVSDPIHWNRVPLSWTNLFNLMTVGGPMSAHATKAATPRPRTLFVQYIDIKDPTLLMQIQKNALPEARTADRDAAWLLPQHTKHLRAKLQAKYQLWLDSTDDTAFDDEAAVASLPLLKDKLPNYGEGGEENEEGEEQPNLVTLPPGEGLVPPAADQGGVEGSGNPLDGLDQFNDFGMYEEGEEDEMALEFQ